MVKKTPKLDPGDGLIVGEVGPWATEKHHRVRRYIQASRGARAKFLAPNGTGGASYISLIQRVAGASIQDIENLISELESLRDLLHAEAERVHVRSPATPSSAKPP